MYMPNPIKILDHGFVELVDTLGNDLTVVNAARVSHGKRKNILDDSDRKLIRYLAEHKHWSPFRHVQLQFHCKVPEFVARQWYKHVVGIAYSEAPTNDHAWNEISQRYVDASGFDFYVPTVFRRQSQNNKQATTDEYINPFLINGINRGPAAEHYRHHCHEALALYRLLVESGVGKEQARGVLPLTVYTEFYWTASLQAVMNFIALRDHPGAQWEIQQYALVLKDFVLQALPVAGQALLDVQKGGQGA